MLLWVYQEATNCPLEYLTPGWEWLECRIKSYITRHIFFCPTDNK